MNTAPKTPHPADRRLARTLILFGATGDLSRRMLLPSLFALYADGLTPPDLEIWGTARKNLSDEEFRAVARDALMEFLPEERRLAEPVEAFLARLHYRPIDMKEPASAKVLAEALGPRTKEPLAIFLSIAPSLFEPAVTGLKEAGLTGPHARIALEKPLGSDLASSHVVNDAIRSAFPEPHTFRIDHYLGKETVQNLLALRFGNVLFEPLWNAQSIEHVQITVAETVGLEGRNDYYDGAGALRDMVQNHMLQLLALIAMEPPAHFAAAAVRDEKVKVLRSLRAIDRTNVADHTVIGQYGEGFSNGGTVPGYAHELGRSSNTETFVALKAHIDNWRWKGVPFYLRTGKRLAARQTEVSIAFKPVPHSIFAERGGQLQSNKLRIRLQPQEDIRLLVMAKVPGLDRDGVQLREVPLDLSLANEFSSTQRRIAYERLLLDFLEGDPTLFVRRDEVEAQWAWIDRIRDGWQHSNMQPRIYGAGTWGPASSIALIERNGASWSE
jgi:glucose-6-phosphate 1-dehydrogenase